ncbi:hypothetical protein BS78_04G041800 [Paspalum vaginatum]|uniref:Knottins-like domain-containing protein n=1 Tax=Paspalum vaginatum TaxID=158149 RepID=A0A9W7X6C6_9POAL|nr:hypothetical protein BS78_K144700 [Paspalum vaginatum]KAJ1277948.1 hypothetical protein BS78_04G041800 [Paspalum vaginatum]
MAPSRKNLFAAAGILLLLAIVAAAGETASVEPLDTCRHLSGSFQGLCRFDDYCRLDCMTESSDNIGGECDSNFFSRCWCITNCATEAVAPTSAPIRP